MKWQVVSKNHATGERSIIKTDIETKEKAEKFAVSCSLNQTNKDIVYEAQEQND